MTSYRITKFNPAKRNEQGNYLDISEWTSISDIGQDKYDDFSYDDYEKIESAYVQAVKLSMQDNNIEYLTIGEFLRYDKKRDFNLHKQLGRLRNIDVDFDKEIKNLKVGMNISLAQIDKIVRLILRETMDLIFVNLQFEVEFGFDYYMYIKCNNLKSSTIAQIENIGLFVEPDTMRKVISITDKDGNIL